MIVVKAGGNEGLDLGAVCADVAELVHQGQQLVLVHGGSHETDAMSEKLGHPPRYVTSDSGYVSRYTDRQTLEIFVMVTAGRINKLVVERLQALGVNAVGLSGLDGRLLEAERKIALRIVENGKRKVLRDDYSGRITHVNTVLLQSLLSGGYTPVVAPLAISHDREALNVDGDRVAAAISASVQAQTLVILSNVPGLLKEFRDEDSLIPHVPADRVEEFLDLYAKGRMKKKILGAAEALHSGVEQVVIADGREQRPLMRALLGHGTVIK